MTDRGTSRSALTAAAEASALVLAQALGLGDSVRVSAEWPIDDGDTVLRMELSGESSGILVVGVNDDVSERLMSDTSMLGAAFEAARVKVVEAVGFELAGGAVEIGDSTQPTIIIEILDEGQLTAIAGLTLPLEEAVVITATDFEPESFAATPEPARPTTATPLSVLNDVMLVVTAELGRTTMPVREILDLTPGMVVEIDRSAGSPIDLLVNGRRIAAGEVVVIDEEFGIRITEILATAERPR